MSSDAAAACFPFATQPPTTTTTSFEALYLAEIFSNEQHMCTPDERVRPGCSQTRVQSIITDCHNHNLHRRAIPDTLPGASTAQPAPEHTAAVLLSLFLAAQAAAAPIPVAAAAACLLAHHLRRPAIGPAAEPLALHPPTAEAVVKALARPGMLAAMARCPGAETAAGQLAVAALHGRSQRELRPEAVVPLAPALPAALAAALAGSGSGGWHQWLPSCCTAAGFLDCVAAAGPEVTRPLLPDALQRAANLVKHLDEALADLLLCEYGLQASGSDGGGSEGGGSSDDSDAEGISDGGSGGGSDCNGSDDESNAGSVSGGGADSDGSDEQQPAGVGSGDGGDKNASTAARQWLPQEQADMLARGCGWAIKGTIALLQAMVTGPDSRDDGKIAAAMLASLRVHQVYEHALRALAAMPAARKGQLLAPLLRLLPHQGMHESLQWSVQHRRHELRSTALSTLQLLIKVRTCATHGLISGLGIRGRFTSNEPGYGQSTAVDNATPVA